MQTIKREKLLKSFNEWMGKIENGIREKNGNSLSEATRMALAYALILHSEDPDFVTPEIVRKMRRTFARAFTFVHKERKEGNGPDKCYDLYEQNISKRLNTLQELQLTP